MIVKKRIKQFLAYLVISFVLILTLTGCSSNDVTILKEKAHSEIAYIDTQLLEMLNKVNGISFKNYMVSAEKIEQNKSSEASSKSEGTSQTQSSSDSQSQSSSGSSGAGDSGSQAENANKNYMNYNMEPNNILSKDKKIDWVVLKSDIESLYSSWSTVVLDLYKLNINNDDILNFGHDLDTATQAIKKEDKNVTLISLAKLYSYLPKFMTSYSDNSTKTNILKTKSSILNAYALIEQNKPEQVKTEIANAEQSFMPIINAIEANKNNQFNISKTYILMKELESSIDLKDLDIFYIKYKNLMEELTIIS